MESDKIPDIIISQIQSDLLGKRIKFSTKSGKSYKGTCDFIGYNKYFPSWELQITIDRTPIPNVLFNSIELLDESM